MSAVLVVFMIVQIGIAALLRDPKRLIRTVVGGLVAIPAAATIVRVMRTAVEFSDNVANGAIKQLQHESLSVALLRVLGMTPPKGGGKEVLPDVGWQQGGTVYRLLNGQHASFGQVIIAALLVALMALASLVLYLLLETRNLGLLALAAMAAVGLVFIGQPVLAVWAKRWVTLVTGLLMSKPLAAGVLVVLVRLTGEATALGPMLVFSIGIVIAAFAPVWAVKLVNFTGEDVGSAIARRPSVTHGVQKTQTVGSILRVVRR